MLNRISYYIIYRHLRSNAKQMLTELNYFYINWKMEAKKI